MTPGSKCKVSFGATIGKPDAKILIWEDTTNSIYQYVPPEAAGYYATLYKKKGQTGEGTTMTTWMFI